MNQIAVYDIGFGTWEFWRSPLNPHKLDVELCIIRDLLACPEKWLLARVS